jgi:hypothetical protein
MWNHLNIFSKPKHQIVVRGKCLIADYLSNFEKSPYVLAAKEYQNVEGVSTLRGSWRSPNEQAYPVDDFSQMGC